MSAPISERDGVGDVTPEPEVVLRDPIIVRFNTPFPLPIDLNLDPTNDDYLDVIGVDKNISDEEIIVDIVPFEVESTGITGNIDIAHIKSYYEADGGNIFRPSGPTGPYRFDVNFSGLAEAEAKLISAGIIFENKTFGSKMTWDERQIEDGELVDTYTDVWIEEKTGEEGDVHLVQADLPNTQFVVFYRQPTEQ